MVGVYCVGLFCFGVHQDLDPLGGVALGVGADLFEGVGVARVTRRDEGQPTGEAQAHEPDPRAPLARGRPPTAVSLFTMRNRSFAVQLPERTL